MSISTQETELGKAKKFLSDLSYTQPDVLIQHSLSLLQTFSNFKLLLSTVEKNGVEYQLAQLTGPGFTSLLREDTPSFLIHLWLDRGYPLQPPDVTLTDISIPDQYLQPFYNPETFKIEYSAFYEWSEDPSLLDLLLAATKVLAHTSLAWVLQISKQQRHAAQDAPAIMGPLRHTGYPQMPNYPNGASLYDPGFRYPNTQRFVSQNMESIGHPQAKNSRPTDCPAKHREPKNRGTRRNRRQKYRDRGSDSDMANFSLDPLPPVEDTQSNTVPSQSKSDSTTTATATTTTTSTATSTIKASITATTTTTDVKIEPCEGIYIYIIMT